MEEYLEDLISGDEKKIHSALDGFLSVIETKNEFTELNEKEYRAKLWGALAIYLKSSIDSKFHAKCLTCLRILSREKCSLNEIISEDLLMSINHHAGLDKPENFVHDKSEVAVEALKCMCNIFFQSDVAAALAANNGTLECILKRVKTYVDGNVPDQIKFFDMKLLFILTAKNPKLRNVLTTTEGDQILTKMMADMIADKSTLSNDEVDLSCEILKVLFNVTMHIGEEEKYNTMVEILGKFLMVDIQDSKKRVILHSQIINLLTNMPIGTYKLLITPVSNKNLPQEKQFDGYDLSNIYIVLEFLKSQFSDNPTVSKQQEMLSPVLIFLLRAAMGNRTIRKYLRQQILPPLRDVKTRPEEGNTLRNHLCRLLTSPITSVHNFAAELLFVLCKENVQRMIKYTGYGNAAGLFAKRGLLGGRNGDVSQYSDDSADSETEEYKEYKHGINPVLGCYEPPHPSATAHMTDEQKEYEAMKLVNLMDSLTRTGIVKPCRVGPDGKPVPVEHVMQLQEGLRSQQVNKADDSDEN